MFILFDLSDETIKQYNEDEIADKLYYIKASIPTVQQLKKSKTVQSYLEYYKINKRANSKADSKANPKEINYDAVIDFLKDSISKLNYKIPLYDEYSKNLHIISRDDVYNRVFYRHYRFPDKNFLKEQEKRLGDAEGKIKSLDKYTDPNDYNMIYIKAKAKKELQRINNMIMFLNYYNLDVLFNTYVSAIYFYSNKVGKNLTFCVRPSFVSTLKHITPYYTRSELINLALNMGIIKPDNKYYDDTKLRSLCDKVVGNDVGYDIIENHQKWITENDCIGLVQYYSLQGSYFINQYMRNMTSYKYKNKYLEGNINPFWDLVIGSPPFDKSYIVYRFIHSDSHLQHLKIGDVYTTPSFLSTTRDPFYRSDVYKFGFILEKIKIKPNVKGVALCIEPVSHFPKEQELIFPPLTKLRLVSRDENTSYYHTDDNNESKVRTKYEFEYIGHDDIEFVDRPVYGKDDRLIDFLSLKQSDAITITERINHFVDSYTKPFYQFRSKIGNTTYTISAEWYNSSDVYKNYYATRTNNGFSLYSINDNYITFMIELGHNNDRPYMFVNYYFKHSATNKKTEYSDDEFLTFISSVAYYFKVGTIMLYADYVSCDLGIDRGKLELGGNYCSDFYNYLKNGIRKYDGIIEVSPKYSFYQLDRLKKTNPKEILSSYDRGEVFQIYKRGYRDLFDEEKHNLADFYVWLVEYRCLYVEELVEKMDKLYKVNNPFKNDYYIFESSAYLYNRGLINHMPTYLSIKDIDGTMFSDRPQNTYRIDTTDNYRFSSGED